MQKKTLCGYTLLELMITLAVIALLASIAYPAYQDYVMRARRGDAKTALMSLQQAQEKFRASCIEYADTIVGDDYDGVNDSTCDTATPNYVVEHNRQSPDENYDLSISGANGTSYTLTATVRAGGAQVNDSNCKTLSIDQDGNKTSTDSADNASSGCWDR